LHICWILLHFLTLKSIHITYLKGPPGSGLYNGNKIMVIQRTNPFLLKKTFIPLPKCRFGNPFLHSAVKKIEQDWSLSGYKSVNIWAPFGQQILPHPWFIKSLKIFQHVRCVAWKDTPHGMFFWKKSTRDLRNDFLLLKTCILKCFFMHLTCWKILALLMYHGCGKICWPNVAYMLTYCYPDIHQSCSKFFDSAMYTSASKT